MHGRYPGGGKLVSRDRLHVEVPPVPAVGAKAFVNFVPHLVATRAGARSDRCDQRPRLASELTERAYALVDDPGCKAAPARVQLRSVLGYGVGVVSGQASEVERRERS